MTSFPLLCLHYAGAAAICTEFITTGNTVTVTELLDVQSPLLRDAEDLYQWFSNFGCDPYSGHTSDVFIPDIYIIIHNSSKIIVVKKQQIISWLGSAQHEEL